MPGEGGEDQRPVSEGKGWGFVCDGPNKGYRVSTDFEVPANHPGGEVKLGDVI
jgi:hypothetical protein